MYQDTMTKIREAANEALGEKRLFRGRKNVPWWTAECDDLIKYKKQVYHKWLSRKDIESRKEYTEATRAAKKAVNKAINTCWQKKCEEIDGQLGSSRSTEAWRTIRSLRDNTKENAKIQLISVDDWIKHYTALLTEDRPQFCTNTQNGSNREEYLETSIDEDDEISLDEFLQAVKSTKNGRAVGPNGIPIELIKHGPDSLAGLLTYIFNLFLRGEEIPEEWRLAHIINLYKKGDRKKCSNYRGLSVTNSLSRLYGKIIKNKIEKYVEIDEEQSGFRAGRSCVDNVFCLKQVIEKRTARNQETHLLFIDLQKAYDSVPLCQLWDIMATEGVKHTHISAIQRLYGNMYSCIKIGKEISQEFKVTKGLRQGCSIAPTLFKIYLNGALKQWKEKCGPMGIQLGQDKLYTLYFADDQVILAEDRDDIHYMLRKLKDEYSKWGLTINAEKTEYLVINGDSSDLRLDNQIIKSTNNYKYLGIKITNDGTNSAELASRIGQGNAATRQLHPLLWDNSLTKKTKIRLYKTVIESISTYGAELWVLPQKEKRKLRAMEMAYWRRCCGLIRMDRVRNDNIRDSMGIDLDIIETIEAKRLRWYGHVQRMPAERWPKKVIEWYPEGRLRRGRPRRTWKTEVSEAMDARNLTGADWTNRTRWRQILGCGKRRQL